MILVAYVILGHKEWQNGLIKIFALYPEESCDQEREQLNKMIAAGQLPIAPKNIQVIPRKLDIDPRTIISEKSKDADLTIVGFHDEVVKHDGVDVFEGYEAIGNTLFVNAAEQKNIK